ncbi:MAG: AglZ/HisF2 family acetamidino modification protein [Chitinophagaceae bacterium]
MLKTRIIPVLLLKDESLVKTVQFGKYGYIGDSINTCRIFNELEVDELCFLDISASKERKEPDYKILQEISNECFMPLSYGGGVFNFEQAERIFKIGFEKIIINSASFTHPGLISEIAKVYGSQAVVVAVDVKKNFWGKYEVFGLSGTVNHKKNPVDWVKEVESLGAGEILLTSIDREGTWKGFDVELVRKITDTTTLPVIAHGGAGSVKHIEEVVKMGNASAVALGSMVVYQRQGLGVLVNFPDKRVLEQILL